MTDKNIMVRHDADETEEREDADAGTQLDKFLSKLDSRLDDIGKRLDALEEDRSAEEEAEDKPKAVVADKKAKKDKKDADPEGDEAMKAKMADLRGDKDEPAEDEADEEDEPVAEADEEDEPVAEADEEDEPEEDRHDARLDAIPHLARKLRDVTRLLPKPMTDEEIDAQLEVQARADEVFQALGKSAPRPLNGEDLMTYRRRMVNKLKVHSDTWKGANLHAISDAHAFDAIEKAVYADAVTAGRSPARVGPGQLQPIEKNQGGHTIRTFVGDPSAWMDDIAGPTRQFVQKIGA